MASKFTANGLYTGTYNADGTFTITSSNLGAVTAETLAKNQTLTNGSPFTPTGGVNTSTFTYVGAVYSGTTFVGFVATTGGVPYYFATSTTVPSGPLTVTTSENFVISPSGDGSYAACFIAGTGVRTPAGDVAVETLKTGDLVTLSDGRTAPVSWLGRQTVSMVFADPLRVLPVRVKADALGEGLPARDLLLSPDHALLVDGILAQAGALVNGVSIVRETQAPAVFTYYHVEVADHSLILAENLPAETFVDNVDRMAFDNWEEHQKLYGDAASIPEMDYPRAKSARQVPQATRDRLLAQGEALYGTQRAA